MPPAARSSLGTLPAKARLHETRQTRVHPSTARRHRPSTRGRVDTSARRSWALDLVIWDNRCTMHRATPFADEMDRRELRHVTTLDLPDPVPA
ncbi:MAG: TauD/TfdA family dioxygenase [Candidatus Rokuibacteriota bacterium]